MKVRELVKELQVYDKDEEVYLSNDIEGNSIKTIYQVAITQDGKFVDAKPDEKAEVINGKRRKWIRTNDFLTIYPTDDIVNNY